MKPTRWIWIAFLTGVAAALSTTTPSPEVKPTAIPFHSAEQPTKRAFDILQLLKRSGSGSNCPGGYNACTKLGGPNVCCRLGTNCSRDAADNIACCPTGASCTGSLTKSQTSTGTGFMFPQTASASTTAPGITATGPTLTGAPYPFVVIPTTFSNAEACSSYYSLCQSEYTQCTAKLGGGGGGYGVTVAAPSGAGVTIPGGGGGGGGGGGSARPSAQSVCSSLSMDACHGLQMPHCDTYGQWSSDENVAVSRRTSVQDLVFGLLVGAAGVFI